MKTCSSFCLRGTSVYLILFLSLAHLNFVNARGQRIDIYSQGGSDIRQLRQPTINKNVMLNALPRNSVLRWTKMVDSNGNYIIPYVISGLYDKSERAIIMEAMRRIQQNTCIRFVKRGNERDYIDIQNQANEGCYTSVGRTSGRNIVMLEANEIATCIETDIVQHEIFHSIGLWHEHMRYDRDDYITVHFDNIELGYESQFEKIPPSESTTYNQMYDYKSIMHYAEDAFAKRGLISMETKNPSFQKVIGMQRDASVSDYTKICLMYQCPSCMGKEFKATEQSATKAATSKPLPTLPSIFLPVGPAASLAPIYQQGCDDMFPRLCSSLQSRSLLKCPSLADLCCHSCLNSSTESTTTTTTSAPKKPEMGFFRRLLSFFD